MPAPKRGEKLGRRVAAPDLQEDRALERASEAMLRFYPATPQPRSLAAVAISEWIMARTSMAASIRINADLMFDLGDARLRGFLEAALPAIGASLAGIPADVALFELTKEQIVDVFIAGILGAQEAAVSAGESLGFPFDDEIPFGAPLTDAELSH